MEPVVANPPFSLPSETSQDKLIAVLKESIAITEASIVQMRESLKVAEHANYKDKQFLAFLLSQREKPTGTIPPLLPPMAKYATDYGVYPADGTQAQKIGYIVAQPHKYGVSLFATTYPIVSAVFQEEPHLLEIKESVADKAGFKEKVEKAWRKKYGEAISRMASDGKLIKMRQIGTKEPLYYISPKWLINDQPKPEYSVLLAGLELAADKDKGQNITDIDEDF
jgi:hypothetical protein